MDTGLWQALDKRGISYATRTSLTFGAENCKSEKLIRPSSSGAYLSCWDLRSAPQDRSQSWSPTAPPPCRGALLLGLEDDWYGDTSTSAVVLVPIPILQGPSAAAPILSLHSIEACKQCNLHRGSGHVTSSAFCDDSMDVTALYTLRR